AAERELAYSARRPGEVRPRARRLERAAPEGGRPGQHRRSEAGQRECPERNEPARTHTAPSATSPIPSSVRIEALSASRAGPESRRGRGSVTSITVWTAPAEGKGGARGRQGAAPPRRRP